jgi:hypothetical protein
MSQGLTHLEREAVLARLGGVFEAPAAEALADVLDQVVLRRIEVTRQDFHELRDMVARLAEGQQALVEGQQALVEGQQALQDAVARLTEAQARTEERVGRLEEAQARTEERVGRLEEAMIRMTDVQISIREELRLLNDRFNGLSEKIGGMAEDDAYDMLPYILHREFGWDVGTLERSWQQWDGGLEEVDIFGQAVDPTRPGQTIWIVGEVKLNLTIRQVERFAKKVARARQHLIGEVFPVCFCYRARRPVQERLKELGIHLIFSYGRVI